MGITPGINCLYMHTLRDLEIKAEPSFEAQTIGQLRKDTLVKASNVGGHSAWVYIGNGWICVQNEESRYVEPG